MLCRSGRRSGNAITPWVVVVAARSFCILLLTGCGGGGSPPMPALPTFPPFTAVRSDFLDPTEGLASNPMQVAMPPCVYLPGVQWQDWLCSGAQALPTVYSVTNAFTTTGDAHFAWIIARNNEFLQTPGCNTGPPNASLGRNDYPFGLTATEAGLTLTLTHDARDFCGKVPYLSAAYLRGVQRDAQGRLMGWGELGEHVLAIDLDVQRAADTQVWLRVLTHFHDPRTGQRYFVNRNYIFPDAQPALAINWNWPYIASFQYPGAKIYQPAQDPTISFTNGVHRIEIPIRQEGLAGFPEFAVIKPDFLGVEIALELGPVVNTITTTIRAVQIRS